jgi:lipopolysaccharide/colanic/teichoic acid biosynthesis glycosyltransferase
MISLFDKAAKRLFDSALSLVGLLLGAPLVVLIATMSKFASPGPIVYRGLRVGRCGKPFYIFKFRTMLVEAERLGGSATAGDDFRLTKFGKFLRRYKLDELPQLVNVLKGEMSFVGPRPEVQKYVSMYSEEEKALLQLRPGITDWASIWNSDEAAVLEGSRNPEQTYEELIRPTKILLQLMYLRDHSLLIDVKILCHTLVKLINKNWTPKRLKPYGRVKRYSMLNETSKTPHTTSS